MLSAIDGIVWEVERMQTQFDQQFEEKSDLRGGCSHARWLAMERGDTRSARTPIRRCLGAQPRNLNADSPYPVPFPQDCTTKSCRLSRCARVECRGVFFFQFVNDIS